MIELINLSKSFDSGNSYVVDNISLHIETGETLVLLGSSGCGKTTTLKMINRLIEPSSGIIKVDDSNIMTADPVNLRRTMGYVFQQVGLFPHMTIEENISIVLRLQGKTKSIRVKRAHALLELINLSPQEYAKRFPEELSGGQQQRVGVARALAADPAYLLMDEPFGALDAITRNELQDELLRLKEDLKKTIIFVTHDIAEAVKLADRIAVMHAGHIEQVGTATEITQNPATEFVAQLIESSDYNA